MGGPGWIDCAALRPNPIGSRCSQEYAADGVGFLFSNPPSLRCGRECLPPRNAMTPTQTSWAGVMADREGLTALRSVQTRLARGARRGTPPTRSACCFQTLLRYAPVGSASHPETP